MSRTIHFLESMSTHVSNPEELFGVDDPKREYRRLAKERHPDRGGTEAGFKELQLWWDRAQLKMKAGTYGDMKPYAIALLRIGSREWSILRLLRSSNGFRYYEAESEYTKAILKACSSPDLRKLAENEHKILQKLNAERPSSDGYSPWPIPIAFSNIPGPNNTRLPGILYQHPVPDDLVSLRDVMAAYPSGLDMRDVAWMVNRLLDVVGFSESWGFAHTALTPDNVFISPAGHLVYIEEWQFATEHGSVAKYAPTGWKHLRAQEIREKRPVSNTTDLYAVGALASNLLHGCSNASTVRPPSTASSHAVMGLLRSCTLPVRPFYGVGQLFQEFAAALERAYGPRKFRPFTLPHPT